MAENFNQKIYKDYLIKVKTKRMNFDDVPEPYKSKMRHIVKPEDFKSEKVSSTDWSVPDMFKKPFTWVTNGAKWAVKTVSKGVKIVGKFIDDISDFGEHATDDLCEAVTGEKPDKEDKKEEKEDEKDEGANN